MRHDVLVGMTLALAGCATAEQRQAKVDAQNATDDAQCRNYGAQPGTTTYTECRMLIATQRQNIEAARDAQRRDALAAAGITLMQQGR